MKRFDFAQAGSTGDAVRMASASSRFLAGGTNLIDLLKSDVEQPDTVIDINRLQMSAIESTEDGGLRLGALATNADTARDPLVTARYPLLASAILAGASPQLRNAATNGGNLNQRTRCYYFYDTAAPCNKRDPGSGCGAIGGLTRIHAILGASSLCIATHPSDMCVALAALDAVVRVTGPAGERSIAFADYHRLPGDEPWRDNTLARDELVTAIELPPGEWGTHYSYLKLRDRLSYAFALVSVAVQLRLEADGRIAEARVALGGVAHKPWRVPAAEALLAGAAPSDSLFRQVAERITEGAAGQGANDFKIELARRAIVRALRQAVAGRPQSQTDKRIA
ncbi:MULTISPECIES: xanthine dehydrogenase family protein subunit M [unclassified Duganella]|uniref:FAD binding domain-containing protein n=1 Tax=unclassified Duganella TaxID=2636909 RepID=UPI0008755E07|nr:MULTISPECIES: xanthine dehydrogenase family protein subunit M [unclassified Duganella]OEZ63851.1 4-hydroxybenzoyl-CoA reductase subunit beta [Duganella sp. HH105]OFA06996.1 4-hydroxybenzoyl-CoA reductase subunit beta [Duganella sp. HH101]